MKTATGLILLSAVAVGAYFLLKKDGATLQEAAAPQGVNEGVIATDTEIKEATAQKIREGQPDAVISQQDIGNLRERQMTASFQAEQSNAIRERLEAQQQGIGVNLSAKMAAQSAYTGSMKSKQVMTTVKDETGTRIYIDGQFKGWKEGTMTSAAFAVPQLTEARKEQAGSISTAQASAAVRAATTGAQIQSNVTTTTKKIGSGSYTETKKGGSKYYR